MSYVRSIFRRRPIYGDLRFPERLLKDIMEAWNRELSPLLLELRDTVNLSAGDVRTVEEDETIALTDGIILGNTVDGALTLTLPPAADMKWNEVTFYNAGTNDLVISAATDETINGLSGLTLVGTYTTATLWSTGTEWLIKASYP